MKRNNIVTFKQLFFFHLKMPSSTAKVADTWYFLKNTEYKPEDRSNTVCAIDKA